MSTRIKRDIEGMERRRREGMRLLAQGLSQAEVARRCGVSRVSVWRWAQRRRSGGPGAWKRRPLGRPPKLNATELRRLEKALLQGARAHGFVDDLWTLRRVAEVIRRQSGVRLHPGHVWRVLVRMGWSLPRPASRATQPDEAAIAR